MAARITGKTPRGQALEGPPVPAAGVDDNLAVQTARSTHAASTGNTAATSSGTAATLTYGAIQGQAHVLGGVAWSYSAAPTSGSLTVKDGSDTVFQIDITAAGPGFVPFNPPLKGKPKNSMTVTLADGGVNNKVNALGKWVE